MSRKKRTWYPGAQYHVMTRGNRRGDLFRKNEDFMSYLEIAKNIKQRHPFELYAFCLMDNHVHLQIRTREIALWKTMHLINTLYSKYFNQEYSLEGHVFQGRYHAVLVETDSYMLETNRYIHQNPVKAKMVKYPSEYRWSSYAEYLDLENSLVDVDVFLKGFRDLEAFINFSEDSKIYIRDLEIEAIMEDH